MARRILVAALAVGLLLVPTTAAARYRVMKPGSRFHILSSKPPKGSEIGSNKFFQYTVCHHGMKGHPSSDPVFTTLRGFPLSLQKMDPPPGIGIGHDYDYRFGQKWHAHLRVVRAPHQPPIFSARAVNPNSSRTVLFFWRCRHPEGS